MRKALAKNEFGIIIITWLVIFSFSCQPSFATVVTEDGSGSSVNEINEPLPSFFTPEYTPEPEVYNYTPEPAIAMGGYTPPTSVQVIDMSRPDSVSVTASDVEEAIAIDKAIEDDMRRHPEESGGFTSVQIPGDKGPCTIIWDRWGDGATNTVAPDSANIYRGGPASFTQLGGVDYSYSSTLATTGAAAGVSPFPAIAASSQDTATLAAIFASGIAPVACSTFGPAPLSTLMTASSLAIPNLFDRPEQRPFYMPDTPAPALSLANPQQVTPTDITSSQMGASLDEITGHLARLEPAGPNAEIPVTQNLLIQNPSDLSGLDRASFQQPADYFSSSNSEMPVDNILGAAGASGASGVIGLTGDLALTLGNSAFGDILQPNANRARIEELNRGMVELSPQARREYIRMNSWEYTKAGGITIFAGGGLGEVIADSQMFNNPNAWRPGGFLYYLGNVGNSPAGPQAALLAPPGPLGQVIPLQDDPPGPVPAGVVPAGVVPAQQAAGNLRNNNLPTYVGSLDDILLTMVQYPQNAMRVYDAVLKRIVQPFSTANSGGVAGLIAQAGTHEVYLTAAHCLRGVNQGDPITLGGAYYLPADATYFSLPEGLTPEQRGAVVDRIASENAERRYQMRGQREAQERMTIQGIEKNYYPDVAVFSVDRAPPRDGSVVGYTGDSIRIIPIATQDPQPQEQLFYYGVPIWKESHSAERSWLPFGDLNVNARVVPKEDNSPGYYENFYKMDGLVTRGFSGTPVFSRPENNFLSVSGIIVRSGVPAIMEGVEAGSEVYAVRPIVIRETLDRFSHKANRNE